MKKTAVLLAMAMVTMATAATANALTLTISNDGTNWQTITDNGIGDMDTHSGLLAYTTETLAGFSTVSGKPGTMALLGIGIFGLAVYGKRRQSCSTAAVS